MKKSILIPIAVLLIPITVIIHDFLLPDGIKTSLVTETCKFFIQLLIVVIGGNFLLNLYNKQKQKKQDAKKFREELHTLLVKAYLKTKKSRLLLRAKCQSNSIPYSAYEREMSKIIDTKIELEIIVHEIHQNKKHLEYFQNLETTLLKSLEAMESYLRLLIKEFTNTAATQADQYVDINPLFHLRNFISGEQIDPSDEEQLKQKLRVSGKLNQNTTSKPSQGRSHFSLFYRKPFHLSLENLTENKKQESDLDTFSA